MRDFPVFTTDNGVASIVLREVPYKGEAYITIRDSAQPKEFLEECLEFCKAVGAKRIYGSGHTVLEQYPLHTMIYKMQAPVESLPQSDCALFPVTEKTIDQWREIYSEKMRNIPNAATITKEDAKELLRKGQGYFVHQGGKLLGIGMVEGDRICAVAAVEPGAGEHVMCALCHGLVSELAQLEVAAENTRAMRLYERLGFVKTAAVFRWYKIFEDVK